MSRIITLVSVITVSSLLLGAQLQGSDKTEQPNIVFLMADDLGYGDLGSYGQEKIKTPNLDQMAAEGMRFTQFYAGSPVCAPSRSVLMTGLHTGHTPKRGNVRGGGPIEYFSSQDSEGYPKEYPIPYSATTVAEVMQNAGYATGGFGKWGLGYPGSEGAPSRQGFDQFFGFVAQLRAHFFYPEFLMWETRIGGAERVPLQGNKVIEKIIGSGPVRSRGQYSQNVITAEALSFIEEHSDNPFFLYVPFQLPHVALEVPAQEKNIYQDEDGNSVFPENKFESDYWGDQQQPRATYAAMVTLMDKHVGQIIDKLKEQGISDNTLVIFTSDNGAELASGGTDPDFFKSNGPLRGYKRDVYEGGIRVPMIAWWPGKIKEGSTSDHLFGFQDMMPTFAELAGASTPPNVDGISIVPTLLGKQTQVRHDYLYWEFNLQGGKQAVRSGKWKAVRLNVSEDPDAPVQLYNLHSDIGETNNIAANHPEIVEEMREIMEQAHIPSETYPLFKTDLKPDYE
ncbi:arylsulfatase [Halalkalibaculum sp. DA384]|uniref:arylsulfatase n=1 Tax=Halalkalibaculum sp. DA384 TaxID=3373606 RepID=UPI0037541A99